MYAKNDERVVDKLAELENGVEEMKKFEPRLANRHIIQWIDACLVKIEKPHAGTMVDYRALNLLRKQYSQYE